MHVKLIILSVALLLVGLPLLGQHSGEFSIQAPLDPEATEVAGIGSYHVVRKGEAVTVQAFDVEGKHLANCEIQWSQSSKAMTCRMPRGSYFRLTWYVDSAEFEDLITGERVVERLEIGPELEGTVSDENHWVISGTRSREEVEREWGQAVKISRYLIADVEFALGLLPADQMFAYQILKPEDGSQSLEPCPGAFCDTNLRCAGAAVSTTRTGCCTAASIDADDCCKQYTAVACCGNSWCTSWCGLFYCDCILDGFRWDHSHFPW